MSARRIVRRQTTNTGCRVRKSGKTTQNKRNTLPAVLVMFQCSSMDPQTDRVSIEELEDQQPMYKNQRTNIISVVALTRIRAPLGVIN